VTPKLAKLHFDIGTQESYLDSPVQIRGGDYWNHIAESMKTKIHLMKGFS
jgi:hypothetical protein